MLKCQGGIGRGGVDGGGEGGGTDRKTEKRILQLLDQRGPEGPVGDNSTQFGEN